MVILELYGVFILRGKFDFGFMFFRGGGSSQLYDIFVGDVVGIWRVQEGCQFCIVFRLFYCMERRDGVESDDVLL